MNPPELAEVKKVRAFVALKTPPTWDDRLSIVQADLNKSIGSADVSWVRPERIHITLRFFGQILPAEIEQIQSLAAPICASISPFTLNCAGLGAFPSIKRPRVIWAGIVQVPSELRELHTHLTRSTDNIGHPPEKRSFQPHLTLGRVKNLDRKKQAEFEHTLQTMEESFSIEESWPVDEVLLMRSHLSSQGSRYEKISTWKLQ